MNIDYITKVISNSQSLIYLLVTIGGWLIFIYKQGQKPEQRQNQRIDEIYKILTDLRESIKDIQTVQLEEIRTTIGILLRREFSRICFELLRKGHCTMAELETVELMFHEYHEKYHLNGRGEELYHRVLSLDIVDENEEVKVGNGRQ